MIDLIFILIVVGVSITSLSNDTVKFEFCGLINPEPTKKLYITKITGNNLNEIKIFDSSNNILNIYNSGNMNNTNVISGGIINEGSNKIIFNSNLTNENIKHSASSFGLRQQGGKIITVKKESYTYEHKDNGKLNNKEE